MRVGASWLVGWFVGWLVGDRSRRLLILTLMYFWSFEDWFHWILKLLLLESEEGGSWKMGGWQRHQREHWPPLKKYVVCVW